MKTDGAPLHGSYFDLLNDKYPDLRKPAASRPPLAPGRHRSTASILLLAAATIAATWWVLTSQLDVAIRADRPAPSATVEVPAVEVPGGPEAPATTADLPESVAATPRVSTSAAGHETLRQDDPGRLSRQLAASQRSTPPPAAQSQRSGEPMGVASMGSSVPVPLAAPAPGVPPAAAPATAPAPVLQPARKVFSPPPEYPPAARQAGEEGKVVVAARIDEAGVVSGAEVVLGRSPALDRAAVETLETWRFEPATRGGQPVVSSYRVAFEFTLRPLARRTPLEVGGDVRPPRRLAAPVPSYPDAAWAEGVTGDVLVRAVIDEQGAVAEVEILKGLPYGMTEAALDAIRRWKFAPATRDGQPVAVYRNLSVRFET